MDKQMLDIYTDYLISSFSYTTATGLSKALGGMISHDKITRFLASDDYNSNHLWKLVRPTIREIETEEGVFIVDDTIEEKPYTDENELITWHFDHTFGRNVKGVNILSLLYNNNDMILPVAFQPIQKTEKYIDKKTGKERRKSVKTKNEYSREMAKVAVVDNQIKCRWFVADVWFSSNDNMEYIRFELKKHFIMPIKTNRAVCYTPEEKRKGQFQRVDALKIPEGKTQQLPFRLQLFKVVAPNGDIDWVVTNHPDKITSEVIQDENDIRWKIEEMHRELKQLTGIEKCQARKARAQRNHISYCYQAWFSIKQKARETRTTVYELRNNLFSEYLKTVLRQPIIPAYLLAS